MACWTSTGEKKTLHTDSLEKWRQVAGNEHIFKGGPVLNLQNIILSIYGNKSK